MDRVVSPPRSEFHKLRQPLEPGERLVFDFFDTHLPPQWEIYVQPHMNGLRPDFVLLHPDVGIAVFEVKDWDLDALDYSVVEKGDEKPKLIGRRNGKSFSMQRDNPVEKVYRYRNELFSLYCPRLAQRNGYAVITAGVIFPFADDKRVKDLLYPCLKFRNMSDYSQYNPVSGRNALQGGDLKAVFPESMRRYSNQMMPAYAEDLRYWLVEPDSAATQRQPIELDDKQKALVTNRTKSGYRRVKGAAGSGKSLVLAARAAELLNQNKTVLVVTFNITLLHYLMDVSVRWPRLTGAQGKTRSDITWLNFHSWCRVVCDDAGRGEDYVALWQERNPHHVLNNLLPDLVGEILDQEPWEDIARYDAVLVDEGQDFLPGWWNLLRKVCKPDGEMLLVADATQDIYETANSWTDEVMKGAGFRGGWSELPVSYRMPKEALEYAREFATRFLQDDQVMLPDNPQIGMGLEPCRLRWVQVSPNEGVNRCVDEVLRFFEKGVLDDLSISDSTFLCANKEFGLSVVKALGAKGIRVVHTYDKDIKESRRQKIGFYMGDARVKATTLHSFKGWESRLLVIYIGGGATKQELALIYTGLTRLKRSVKGSCMTVVCSVPRLINFGATWSEFDDKSVNEEIAATDGSIASIVFSP